jgi:hypothetical protein
VCCLWAGVRTQSAAMLAAIERQRPGDSGALALVYQHFNFGKEAAEVMLRDAQVPLPSFCAPWGQGSNQTGKYEERQRSGLACFCIQEREGGKWGMERKRWRTVKEIRQSERSAGLCGKVVSRYERVRPVADAALRSHSAKAHRTRCCRGRLG